MFSVPKFDISKEFNDLQWFQFYDKYSKFDWSKGRRETWLETVTRTVEFLMELSENKLPFQTYQEIFNAIYKMEISPSMRLFSNAGVSARRYNEMIYNCGYLLIDDIAAFGEILWLSICGVGFGYSVEQKHINKLPKVNQQNGFVSKITIPDTSEGWKESVDQLVYAIFNGEDVEFNYSLIRPSGTPLKTKGGYASGHEVLEKIHNYIRISLKKAQNRKLTSLEVHDLVCTIVYAGVSGGVRRAALLCLFDFDDELMKHCKDGDYYNENPQRMNSNNSAVWPKNLSFEQVNFATHNMFATGSGEPGIFIREVAIETSPSWRTFNHPESLGINACSEINLEPFQFCNLSTVICRPNDTLETLVEKTRLATIVGDIQSLATNFTGLRKIWEETCKKDRLLGVNHIGHSDCAEIRKVETQIKLKEIAVETDLAFSKLFGVVRSAAILSVKPSGNSSLLYNCGPGVNPEHELYSLRNVTVNKSTAMYRFLFANEIPSFQYKGADERVLFSFPQHKPNSIILENVSAIEQLNYWKQVKVNMMHHNPSCSIIYNNDEIDSIIKWLYENQNIIGGLSFFPRFDSSHPHLPIQKISKEEYEIAVKEFPKLNWDNFFLYENDFDEQTIVQECVSGNCAI